jgi:protein-disulfide isomerase
MLLLAACQTHVTWAAEPPSAPSDAASLRQEVDTLRREVDEMKKALMEIRQALLAGAPSSNARSTTAKVRVGSAPSLGSADAPLTIVEFSDYQCPFCQRFATTTLPQLKRDYIDTGKVRYVFQDFPLDSIHPDARKAAEAAHCAGEQQKYWEMHDALFKNSRALKLDNLNGHAATLNLNTEQFARCLREGKYAATVAENVKIGATLGITGTPSFFIGKSLPDGTIEAVNLRGAQPIANFKRVLDQLLATN